MKLATAKKRGVEYDFGPGNELLLPAHCRHRVTGNNPALPTIWLALLVGRGSSEG